MDQAPNLNDDITHIEASGVLGRSPVYARLLRYLAAATGENRSVSEIEIATDVFRKGGDFDSNQDSLVRVYVHNLRQRLDRYYKDHAEPKRPRLTIPRGEYRLTYQSTHDVMVHPSEGEVVQKKSKTYLVIALLAANLVLLAVLTGMLLQHSDTEQVSRHPIWSPILDSKNPLLVVVGDYYIFAQLDASGNIQRMVREFDINSQADLNQLLASDPDHPADYMDLDLTYLPQSTAFALKDVLGVAYAAGKRVTILPASKLRVSDLKTNNVVYVGYLSALGLLEPYVFATSGLRIGDTYDELIDRRSGKYFFSNAGIPNPANHRDFGFLSAFKGPSDDSRVLIIAGTRDSGLMQMAQVVSSPGGMTTLEAALTQDNTQMPQAYEVLLQVNGSGRVSLDASLVHHAELDNGNIWTNTTTRTQVR